jgi:hypothetical protein
MNPHRYSYSNSKADIIRAVLSGVSMEKVAEKNELTVNRIRQIVQQVARRWMRENNVALDANIETLRSNADSINNYVELNSIESKEQITVRLAEKRLKQLQGQLVRVHEQVKVKLASANSLQVEVKIAEVALKDALTIGKQQIEYVK